MTFDIYKIFTESKQSLLDIVVDTNYSDKLLAWVEMKSKSGLSKKQIYDILLELHKDIQTRPDPDDKLHARVADFMDGFTAWEKSFKILPNEPDI
ncbi:MAG: hypothetical protein V4677_03030 [Bacteroidota bacterium]